MAIVKERTKDVLIDDSTVNFESLYLSLPVLEALKENHFIKPSPIQLKAIPLGKCGLDLIVKSKSGTGKTAVFAIIALEMIDITKHHLQALILAPTREIAVQSCDVITTIGKHIKDLKVEHFIGGLPVKEDISKAQGCHIAVASPGRMLHLITSGTLDVQNVKLFVLDEADSLMESSFQADINKIFHSMPKSKQMLAVSATFPNELDTFLSQYMHIPTHVSATMDTPLLLGLKHFVSITQFNANTIFLTKYKNNELLRLLTHVSFTQCLVFCNYQTRAEEVCSFLNSKNWKAEFISGAQTQKQRLEVLKRLKEFQCRILLSTDLTARGIDAVNVDLVINYDVPNDESTYLHRMGRAGRYGSKGICVTMAAKGTEVQKFGDIIGAIGGCEMSVPVLPKEDLPDNIWEAEVQVKEFARLQGTLKQQEMNGIASKDQILRSVKEILREDIENNVLEEKTVKQKKAPKKAKENKQKVVKVTEIVETIEDADETTALLALLAAGKADSSVTKATPDKTSIFNKNLSLLTVSGLLDDDDDLDVNSSETAKTIESFIATLQEPETTKNDLTQRCDDLNDCTTPVDVDIEDVFTHAFNYAICKNKPNWADLYDYQEMTENKPQDFHDKEPVNLMKDLMEYVTNQVNPDDEDYEEYYEEVSDYDDNDYNEEVYYEETQPSMEWIPVENVTQVENASASPKCLKQMCTRKNIPKQNVTLMSRTNTDEQYKELFDSTVQHLEDNFNTLESVPAFENMWAQWQRQMNSVRDYVQQNIYLTEMASYRAGFQH